MNPSPIEISRDELLEEFLKVVADAEALLHATAEHGGEELAAMRAGMHETLTAAKARCGAARDGVVLKGRAAADATDSYVRENPWSAVGVAAGLGLLIGLLGRRR
ncbi:MAG: DUF883 domain-containing protein [Gammaproteobacteria bacterium]|nr:DUF883 domain-containing protein [Gammaproteobacteria bacterium]